MSRPAAIGRVLSGNRSLLLDGRSGPACAPPKPRCSLFPGKKKRPLGASSRPVVGLRLCLCVPIGTTPPSSRPSVLPLTPLVLSRLGSRGDGKRLRRVSALAVSSVAARSALFAVLGGLRVWHVVLVRVVERTDFFVRLRLQASPSGFAFGLRLRTRLTPRTDSKPTGGTRGRSFRPRKQPRQIVILVTAKCRRAAFWRISSAPPRS